MDKYTGGTWHYMAKLKVLHLVCLSVWLYDLGGGTALALLSTVGEVFWIVSYAAGGLAVEFARK